MITINVPKAIYKDFLDFLDSAQCQFTQEELKEMAPRQVAVLTFVSNLVGDATPRFETIRAQKRAFLVPHPDRSKFQHR